MLFTLPRYVERMKLRAVFVHMGLNSGAKLFINSAICNNVQLSRDTTMLFCDSLFRFAAREIFNTSADLGDSHAKNPQFVMNASVQEKFCSICCRNTEVQKLM